MLIILLQLHYAKTLLILGVSVPDSPPTLAVPLRITFKYLAVGLPGQGQALRQHAAQPAGLRQRVNAGGVQRPALLLC